MKAKHTPGHWDYKVRQGMISIESMHPTEKQIHKGDISIAGIWGLSNENKANAKLIAAAPDLLEVLQQAFDTMLPEENPDLYAKMNLVIKKATL